MALQVRSSTGRESGTQGEQDGSVAGRGGRSSGERVSEVVAAGQEDRASVTKTLAGDRGRCREPVRAGKANNRVPGGGDGLLDR